MTMTRCLLKDDNDTPEEATVAEMERVHAHIRGMLHEKADNILA